jgi:hypothetical protein
VFIEQAFGRADDRPADQGPGQGPEERDIK